MTKLDYIVALKILLEHSVNFNKKQYEVSIQNAKKNAEIEHTKLESHFIKSFDIACLCFFSFWDWQNPIWYQTKLKNTKASKKTITTHILLLIYDRRYIKTYLTISSYWCTNPNFKYFKIEPTHNFVCATSTPSTIMSPGIVIWPNISSPLL